MGISLPVYPVSIESIFAHRDFSLAFHNLWSFFYHSVVCSDEPKGGKCNRNYLFLDGMHICPETLASRFAAGVACLLGCVYVGPRMGTDSFCVMCLPICEILAVPARLHTGSPEMRTGVGFDLYTRVTNGKERAPGERGMQVHKKSSRTILIPVCIL